MVGMMEDVKVTLRMGPEDLQIIDDFVDENPDIGNRSNLIRAAIRAYVSGDAPGNKSLREEGSGIFVRFSEIHLDVLSRLKDEGICLNEEEFVRKCVLDEIIPKGAQKETVENSFKLAQMTSKMK
jgi:Arc/MetJ-type ribon-helix-helix transcriptional regulator